MLLYSLINQEGSDNYDDKDLTVMEDTEYIF